VFFRKIQSGLRTDNRQSEIEYKISRDNVIWTDMEEAIGEYTSLVDDPQLYPADFIMALSYLLAFYIAPQVTRGDPYKMRDSIFKLYLMQVGRASSSSVNEESRAEEPKAEWIRGRS
jgi:hypothetical protein